ncbi:MAG: family 10 glycosylhydrolase, partial [Candidatus Sumerlaeia bacterium]|nr:family 10 glycosylhydrolase [Candidatus Sumerlaeia bacterium]
MTDLPQAPREFRGVWVATVNNIDWPSRPGLSTQQQQAELLGILNKCAELNLNAVILQVRPMCDALY